MYLTLLHKTCFGTTTKKTNLSQFLHRHNQREREVDQWCHVLKRQAPPLLPCPVAVSAPHPLTGYAPLCVGSFWPAASREAAAAGWRQALPGFRLRRVSGMTGADTAQKAPTWAPCRGRLASSPAGSEPWWADVALRAADTPPDLAHT